MPAVLVSQLRKSLSASSSLPPFVLTSSSCLVLLPPVADSAARTSSRRILVLHFQSRSFCFPMPWNFAASRELCIVSCGLSRHGYRHFSSFWVALKEELAVYPKTRLVLCRRSSHGGGIGRMRRRRNGEFPRLTEELIWAGRWNGRSQVRRSDSSLESGLG